MALTGRFNFRRSFWGKIILQVEEEVRALWPMSRSTPTRKRWRNATLMDLAAPELRALIDLRFKSHYLAQYEHLSPDTRQPGRAEARPGSEPAGGASDKTVELERMSSFARARPHRSA